MKRKITINFRKSRFSVMALIMSVLMVACLDSGGSDSDNTVPGLSLYLGDWFFNGLGVSEEKTMKISSSLAYRQIVIGFEDNDKLTQTSERVVDGKITHIQQNEDNSEFDSIFIEIDSISITPKTSSQATQWNNNSYGGMTDWVTEGTKIFDKQSPGKMDDEVIWKSNTLIAVKREGDLLEVNERAGFDGKDPDHEVYFLE